jgi:hypothetical protein
MALFRCAVDRTLRQVSTVNPSNRSGFSPVVYIANLPALA